MKEFIKKVYNRNHLTVEEAVAVMEKITSGAATPAEIAAILTALAMKGEVVSELTGFTSVMRKKVTTIKRPDGKKVIDTCGTGGDGTGTFNISTVSAFVLAGLDLVIAKHGNKAMTSKCGSADLMEALGVNINITPDQMADALDKVGIAFLFAPKLHLSMKYAVPVRKEIGIRTAFNILGPMTNPAGADYQIIGVFNEEYAEKIANVINNLGTKGGMVVHGMDGLDEISLTAPSVVFEINNGRLKRYILNPEDYGFKYCALDDLKGGDLQVNKEIALSVLKGAKGPKRDIVLLNAAAALVAAHEAETFKEGIARAAGSIDKGMALAKLNQLIAFTNSGN